MGRLDEPPCRLRLIRGGLAVNDAPAAPAPEGGERASRDDAQVRKAIDLMLGALDARWTVTQLARKVGLSRAAFARRFVASEGVSPLRYLSHARMRRAAELLRATDWGLARVGAAVGYESEFAFNRAFKRAHHVAPGAYRRGRAPARLTLRAAA
ncbi:MAG TPA: AraC family transcriptional regulator [Polyangiaceae bacterium]|nr:AraC family transcriptional regulator [Polyangiaceae bacterium]